MSKLKKIIKRTRKNRWLPIMGIQAIIILVLVCILKRDELGLIWKWIKTHTDLTLVFTLVTTVLGGLIVKWVIDRIVNRKFHSRPYITFEADYMQVFHLSYKVDTLEYSVGEKDWEELGTQNIVFGGERGKLMLRGRSKKGTNDALISFATDATVVCTGDIRTLVDYRHYEKADTKEAKFWCLFEGCTQLAVAPDLPATVLGDECYGGMFYGCTSLKRAPILPAKRLADDCYSHMFYGCTLLEKAPQLPAKRMAKKCYSSMFSGCTSLKRPPILPSTELAWDCYWNMFSGCTSLEYSPELPAKDLVDECYYGMFSGCTSLGETSNILANTMAEQCCSHMFEGCTSLKKAPLLPATELADECYSYMFKGCSLVSEITMLATDIKAEHCFVEWLDGTASSGTFFKNKNANWRNSGIVPTGWTVVKK